MNVMELLGRLRDLDIAIRLDGERLHIDAPRNALTPELHERIAKNKAQILTFLRESADAARGDSQPIERASRDGDLPLSNAQQRLWFLDQLEPGSAAYVMPHAVLVRGEVDLNILEECLTELVRRHESLRTVFESRGGSPHQIIRPPSAVRVLLNDLTHLPQELRRPEARRLIEETTHTPFDLAAGPLFRCQVVRLAPLEHVIVTAFHHIVFDAWSGLVFTRELGELYEAFRSGRPSPLPDQPLQYFDFAQWQRKNLQSGGRERHLGYWRQQLAGDLHSLDLPSDRPRSKSQAAAAASCSLRLPAELAKDLRSVGRKDGASLAMVTLAAFDLLLHRLTGQDDILVGAPVAGRQRVESESMIGFFVNTVVLRSKYNDGSSFSELLRATRKTLLDAHAHQDMPFEELVSALDPHRDLSRTPLFQVFFNHLHFGEHLSEFARVPAEPFDDKVPKSKFDLTLYVEEKDAGVNLRFVYDAALFDADRMAGMLEQYRAVLEQAVADPSQRLADLSLITDSARGVLPDVTRVLAPTAADEALSTLECAGLASFGRRTALVGPSGSWTYEDLDARASALANSLRQTGVERGEVIAIIARRDPLLVCAILGVLRAGAAFAILDPAYPDARLAECWRAAGPRALIKIADAPSAGPLLGAEIAGSTLRCDLSLSVETLASLPADAPTSQAATKLRSDDLAYIAFTSGTTGGVKAILGTHGPVAHFLNWQRRTFALQADDRFSMLSGLAHDPLLRDVFAPLWAGAQLAIPAPEVLAEPARLAEWFANERITAAHLTPAMVHVVGMALGPSRLNLLRYAFVGGERLDATTVARLREFAPAATCVNFYGATETPQAMAYYVLAPGVAETRSEVPLGHGIDGVQLLLIGSGGQLGGVGEVGEIVVRTAYLSRGYRGNDDLTKQRFGVNPFTGAAGDRVYRTGDYGRFLPSGDVEFVGRKDSQVKLRGFRVELGEVEAALHEHPAVSHAVAVLTEDGAAEKRLVAYVVLSQQHDVAELRAHVAKLLPDYAVPSVIVMIDALPLTPNGKVDRRALPSPTVKSPTDGQVGRPLTPLENQLLAIWKQVLGKEDLGVTDVFFDVGGTSLTAVRLFSQLRIVFGKDLPLATLFRAPTVEQLAALMVNEGRSAPWRSVVAIQPSGANPPLFMVPGIGGNVLEFARLARLLGEDQPFFGTQSLGLDGKEPPLRKIEDMAKRYLQELRSIQPHGPYYLGGACMGGMIAFEMAQQLKGAGEDIALLALVDTPVRPAKRHSATLYFLLHRLIFLVHGVRRHLQAVRGRGFKAWLSGGRMVFRIARQMVVQRDVYRGDRSVLYQDLVTAANYEAMINYAPRVYVGDAKLFIASDRAMDPTNRTRLAWVDFVRGGLSVFKLKAKDSGELLKVPHVDDVANIFVDILSAARQARSDHD